MTPRDQTRPADHLYTLRPFPSGWYTTGRDDRYQFVFGCRPPFAVRLRFRADGALVDYRCKEYEFTRELVASVRAPTHALMVGLVNELALDPADRVTVPAGPISVTRFFLDDLNIGIQDHNYDPVLPPNPNEYQIADYNGLLTEFEKWMERGNFIFVWIQYYSLNADGRVIAT